MSLVPCPECQHQVSTRAESCPNCGCPLREDPVIEYKKRTLDAAFWVILALGLVGLFLLTLGVAGGDDGLAEPGFTLLLTSGICLVAYYVRRDMLDRSRRM